MGVGKIFWEGLGFRPITPLTLTASSASVTPLKLVGAGSQTANLQEWLNSAETVLASVNSSGYLGVGATPLVPLHTQLNLDGDQGISLFRNIHATGGILVQLDKGADAGSVRASLVNFSQGGTNKWLIGIPRRGGSSHGNVFAITSNYDINSGGGEFLLSTSGNVSIGGLYALVDIARLSVVGSNAAKPVAIARGASSQTANLQEWQDSAGTKLAGIGPGGMINMGASPTLTIATGVVTITKSYHKVDTEASAATDDLDTINGGVDGDILILRTANASRDVTVKNGTGNLRTVGDFTLDYLEDRIMLQYDGDLGVWLEVSRSNNV